MEIKDEYKKMYYNQLETIDIINNLPYITKVEQLKLKIEYIKQAFEILKEYSKFS